MRVFVAGATGAIGRPLVAQLLSAGHAVVAMTRSPAKTDSLRAAGVDVVVADALDRPRVIEAIAAAEPDVLVAQLTDLPPVYDPRRYREMTAGTNRLRQEGTTNLMDGAVAAGARRAVAQSIAFVYAPGPGPPRAEDAPVLTEGPADMLEPLRAALAGERVVLDRRELEGLVLRYGFFYGPGTWYASDGSIAEQVRRRRLPLVGRGDGVFSFVHVDDAAAATAAAVEHGEHGLYNVCDDEPAPMREWLPAYARALGARPPRRVPKLLARVVAGPTAVMGATRMPGASNAKARRELGWQPRYRSWRQGFQDALG